MARQRRAFLQLRAAAMALQAQWRGRQARLAFAELVRRHQAAAQVQAAFRGWVQRRRFAAAVAAAWRIQMAWRRWQVRWAVWGWGLGS